MTDTSESWREQGENMGLNEETARIELYCNYRDKETWERERQEQRYSSLSEYLQDMINLGRAYRREGHRDQRQANERIEELQQEIENLQRELAGQDQSPISPDVVDTEMVEALLDEQYQTVEEILEHLSENEDLQTNLKTSVEDALYDLASDGRAEYEEGWGWRLGGEQ